MGLIDILILVGIGYVVAKVLGIAGPSKGHNDALPPENDPGQLPPVRSQTEGFDARGPSSSVALPASPPPPPDRETRMAEVRARYVEGKISVEQYEEELDRILRE